MTKKFWIWLHQFFQRKSPRENAAISIANQQQIWFEQCEPGFLVWAQMPLPSEELAKIDPAHRIRPYLILARIKQELTAKACSSSPYSGLREYQTTMLARDHPLGKQTYIDLKHNVTLRAELLQNKPIPVERHDLRRIQKHLVLISQLDHIYHPYLNVPLLWEKGDILEIDHDLWYLQEFIPGKLRLIRLCHQYRAYIEDAGWNLFFCGRRGYFADFAHPAVYQGKTRLELVHRAAAHEIAYADYCQTQGKDQYIPEFSFQFPDICLFILPFCCLSQFFLFQNPASVYHHILRSFVFHPRHIDKCTELLDGSPNTGCIA